MGSDGMKTRMKIPTKERLAQVLHAAGGTAAAVARCRRAATLTCLRWETMTMTTFRAAQPRTAELQPRRKNENVPTG